MQRHRQTEEYIRWRRALSPRSYGNGAPVLAAAARVPEAAVQEVGCLEDAQDCPAGEGGVAELHRGL